MKKRTKIILLVVLAAVVGAGGIFIGMNWNDKSGEKSASVEVDDNAEDWTGNRDTYVGKKNTDTIDIPGFDAMNLKADVTEQSVNLYNPEANTCYFKLSLFLNDGTKLWESGLLGPGKAIYDLNLEKSLPAGEYEDAVLKYQCFDMDEEQTPLNGSEITLTLKVLE